jgi:hypothetical protein
MDFYRRCYGTDGYLTDFPGLTKESATWLGRPKQEGRASGMLGASSPVPLEDPGRSNGRVWRLRAGRNPHQLRPLKLQISGGLCP